MGIQGPTLPWTSKLGPPQVPSKPTVGTRTRESEGINGQRKSRESARRYGPRDSGGITLSAFAGLVSRTAWFALFMLSAPCELTMSWVGSSVLDLNWRSRGLDSTHFYEGVVWLDSANCFSHEIRDEIGAREPTLNLGSADASSWSTLDSPDLLGRLLE